MGKTCVPIVQKVGPKVTEKSQPGVGVVLPKLWPQVLQAKGGRGPDVDTQNVEGWRIRGNRFLF